MKTKLTKTLIVFFSTVLLSSCNIGMINGIQGDRNVITKKRKLSNEFSSVKISTGLDLYLTQGNKNEVVVEADENLQEIIITEIENGVLKIYSDKGIWGAKSTKIYVTFKNITSIKATSGSNVYAENEIKTPNLTVSATSGADINVMVIAENVETKATSGSDIRIAGVTNYHSAKATSGASIKAYALKSKNVVASANSGADIDVYASEKINANATSAADIDFKGNPKKVDKSSSSGASIARQ